MDNNPDTKPGSTQQVTPGLNPFETRLFHNHYRLYAQHLAARGNLPPLAFFRAGALPRSPDLKPGDIAMFVMNIDQGKDFVVAQLRRIARSMDADMVQLFLRSLLAIMPTEEFERTRRFGQSVVSLSQDLQQVEVVLISVQKPGGRDWSAYVEINRDPNGRPSIPGDPPQLEYLETVGRFANILDGNGDHPSLS